MPGSFYGKDQNHLSLFVLTVKFYKVQVMSLLHLLQNPREYDQDRKRGDCISFRIADFGF